MPTFIQEIGGCLTSMLEFRNTLEEMQAFTTKVILMHYRAELAEFDPSKASGFLSQVRLKPQIVTKLSDLTKKLKSNSNSPTWQTDATKAVAEFMNSSGNATNGQSGSAAPKTPPSR
jgi:orotate phosphoribosyltransferase